MTIFLSSSITVVKWYLTLGHCRSNLTDIEIWIAEVWIKKCIKCLFEKKQVLRDRLLLFLKLHSPVFH